MKITINSEQELLDLSRELLHVIYNLRYWTLKWESEHGVQEKNAKKKWEKRVDEILEHLEMTKTLHSNEIKILVGSL